MDVLFGSIDVRELLSTQDFDESSPLSAPDLRLLIDRLQVRSLHIKDKVRTYVDSHHQDFSDIFSRCSSAVTKTEDISVDVEQLIHTVSNDPIDVQIREVTKEIGVKGRELREKREVLGVVQILVNLVGRLKGVREGVRQGRLVDVAEALRGLKNGLRMSGGDDDKDQEEEPVVFGLLRKEWRECFDEVQEVLGKLVEKAVKFEHGNVRVRYRVSVGEVEGEVDLKTVLMAMEIAGVLDYGLAKVADMMVKYVVIPTISTGARFDFDEELEKERNGMDEAVLTLVSLSESEVDSPPMYSRIIQVIKFIYNFICFQNDRWTRCFGKLSWPRISELVISHFLSKAVPDDASKLAEFQNIIKVTFEFETTLEQMMFISGIDDKDRRLSDYAQNVEVHFASRKRKETLAKARSLFLQCDFSLPPDLMKKDHILEGHGPTDGFSEQIVTLLFLGDRCVVSKAGVQLMQLVHQLLQDVCLSSARVSIQFYHAARDALLLYEAIIPVKLEKQLNSVNQIAILVHNDCLFLSQEILGLAFEYRSNFPSHLKEQAVFVDLAPRFCQMADETLQRQVQLVTSNLREAIDGADGFQNTHQMQGYESAKFSIDQVVFILEKVHIIWEPLLPPATYKRTMCTVLDSVFARITKDILNLDDMTAEETLQLQRLIHMTLESLSSLLESLNAINERIKSREDVICLPLDELIPSWRKLRKLADLLDMPLKSITNAWESGELASCGYTSPEMEYFVKAIFTDSPLRRDCLWRISTVNW